MAEDLRKLKDEAATAAEKGKFRKAAELYLKVAQRERDDPQWPHRAGEALKRAGAPAEALPHLVVAAEAYAKLGFLLKAIAVAKIILQIDAKHAATQELLVRLYAKQGTPARAMAPPAPKPTEAVPLTTDAVRERAPTPPHVEPLLTVDDVLPAGPDAPLHQPAPPPVPIEVGAPIETIALADVVPGARPSAEFPALEAVEIPLEQPEVEIIEIADEPERALPEIPLFSSLPPAELRRLIDGVRTVERAPGEAVVRQGEPGDALYVVVHGEVEVSVAGHARPLGRLGEGAFFGELAVLSSQPRAATVTAVAPTELLEIDRATLTGLLRDDPEVLRTLLRFFRDRLIDRLIATSPLFESFTGEEARALAERFRFLELDAEKTPIREGERAGGLLVVLAGACDVVHKGAAIAALGPGDLAGEMSLLAHAPAVATVKTRSKVWALALPRDQFQELIVTHPQVLIYVNDVAERRRARVEKLHLA